MRAARTVLPAMKLRTLVLALAAAASRQFPGRPAPAGRRPGAGGPDRPGRPPDRDRDGRPPLGRCPGAASAGELSSRSSTRADLRPDQRLHRALVDRHRRPGQGGPGPGEHRVPRGRPAAKPGPGGPRPGPGQPGARPDQRQPLAGARQPERGRPAGRGPEERRLCRQAGRSSRRPRPTSTGSSSSRDSRRVTAPFDGTISARNIDIGTLITAGSGPELFHLTQSGTLRVYLDVPQSYVPDIHEGLQADVLVAEYPSKAFPGRVARFAGALDASSRTLLTEVQIPNPGGELLPGMFCRVRFRLKPASPPDSDPLRRRDHPGRGDACRRGHPSRDDPPPAGQAREGFRDADRGPRRARRGDPGRRKPERRPGRGPGGRRRPGRPRVRVNP